MEYIFYFMTKFMLINLLIVACYLTVPLNHDCANIEGSLTFLILTANFMSNIEYSPLEAEKQILCNYKQSNKTSRLMLMVSMFEPEQKNRTNVFFNLFLSFFFSTMCIHLPTNNKPHLVDFNLVIPVHYANLLRKYMLIDRSHKVSSFIA